MSEGVYFTARYEDIISGKPAHTDTRTADEVIEDIGNRLEQLRGDGIGRT